MQLLSINAGRPSTDGLKIDAQAGEADKRSGFQEAAMARFLWTQRQDIGPAPRIMHAMAYDADRGQTLLFGGYSNSGVFGDTWAWDGSYWVQVEDAGPSGRYLSAMCFDNVRSEVLLFGGYALAGRCGDTWIFNGETWTQVEDSGPSSRYAHSLVFDSRRGKAVLFGGWSGEMASDTWEWDGTNWLQVEEIGPPPRIYHACAYDLVQQHTIVFGGAGSNLRSLGDTWAWDGMRWTQIADMGPTPSSGGAMASTDRRPILFGGMSGQFSGNPVMLDDSWTLSGTRWTQRQDMGPAARRNHAIAFDSRRRTLVLFGGTPSPPTFSQTGFLHDTWEYAEDEPA